MPPRGSSREREREGGRERERDRERDRDRLNPQPRGQMSAWKICTPTNWKRAKSYHEILLERKFLRRNGRMPSQSQFYSVFKLKDAKKLTAGARIRRLLRRAQFYGDDIKRLVIFGG